MVKVNISIDDVSPHKRSSTKVFKQCFKLIDSYPDIRFTLFVPAAYWRTKGVTATKTPLALSDDKKFCKELRDLPERNFELGFHGVYHGIPGISNNDEFKGISYNNAIQRFELMKYEVAKCGLVFRPIFRPPAWRMCPAAIQAAKDSGIKVLALARLDYAMDSYQGRQEKTKVVYATAFPPIKPLKLEEKTEIVYHACEWDRNYLDSAKVKELKKVFGKRDIQFCFMEDLVE